MLKIGLRGLKQLKILFGQNSLPVSHRLKVGETRGFRNPGVHSCVVPGGQYRMEETHRWALRVTGLPVT